MGHSARQDQANPNEAFGTRVRSGLSFSDRERSQVFLGSRPRLWDNENERRTGAEEVLTGTWWAQRPRSLGTALADRLYSSCCRL